MTDTPTGYTTPLTDRRALVAVIALAITAGTVLPVLGGPLGTDIGSGQAAASTGLVEPAGEPAPAGPGLSMAFEPNRGQIADETVDYIARGPGHTLLLTSTGTITHLVPEDSSEREQTSVVEVTFEGARPDAMSVASNRLPGTVNHLHADADRSISDVPRFEEVTYEDVYEGIDVRYYITDEGHVEYDVLVAPDADPSQIRLEIDGADEIGIDDEGDLAIQTPAGTLEHAAPVTYQRVERERVSVESRFVVTGEDTVAFELGEHDPDETLVIDPKIFYAAPIPMRATELAVAPDGDLILGATVKRSIETVNAREPSQIGNRDRDAFVARVDTDADTVEWATYYGGTSEDRLRAVQVGPTGAVYLMGVTQSTDLPVVNAFQPFHAGGEWEGFAAKLTGDGTTLNYATYLGGALRDLPVDAVVDGDGALYIVGATTSPDFPTKNAYDPTAADNVIDRWDAFATKLSPDGSQLAYSTFLSSRNVETAFGVAVDGEGSAYVTGRARGNGYPTTAGAFDTENRRGQDAFVTKLSPAGDALAYSTLYGNRDGNVLAREVVVDGQGQATIVGRTSQTDLPLANPFDDQIGRRDGFVARFTADGSELVHASYVGGSSRDRAFDAALAGDGSVYLVGQTRSTDLPVRRAVQPFNDGGQRDGFIGQVTPEGQLQMLSYLGGTRKERLFGVGVDDEDRVHATGTLKGGSEKLPIRDPAPTPWDDDGHRAMIVTLDECPGATPRTQASFDGTTGNGIWWRSNVTVTYDVSTPCPPVVTHSLVDDDPVHYGPDVTVRGDGQHTLTYFSRDAADGTLEAPHTRQVSIDTTPPTTNETLDGVRGTNGWFHSPVTVTLEPGDATSGVAETVHRVDGGAFEAGTSFTVTGDAAHSIAFRSTDVAGNTETTTTAPVRIDQVPPSVNLTRPAEGDVYVLDQGEPLGPALPATLVVGDLTVRADAEDATSGIDRVELWVDGTLRNTTHQAPYEIGWEAGNETAGTHQVRLVAYDVAGHATESQTRNVTTVPTSADPGTLERLVPELPPLPNGSLSLLHEDAMVHANGRR